MNAGATQAAHAGGPRGLKVVARSLQLISLGDMDLDLHCTEQLAEKSQTRAIGDALVLFQGMLGRSAGLSNLLDQLEAAMNLKVGLRSWVHLPASRNQDKRLLCRAWMRSPGVSAHVTWPGHVAWSWQQLSIGFAVRNCSSCLDEEVNALSMMWPH